MNKPNGYYDQARPEVLALVPLTAKRILDVGCGAGALGAALKARQECYVVGIEHNGNAAEASRDVLDYVLCAPAETAYLPQDIIGGRFNCIVFADILEHLAEPGDLLAYARQYWLEENGVVVLSVPNTRHWSILEGLVNGDFNYTDAGLLDRTHLRFFTRRELQKLLWRAGFEQVKLEATCYGKAPPVGHIVQEGRFCFVARDARESSEFYAYQFLATAKKREVRDHGTTSIIIPVCNQLPYTQQCLASLAETTDMHNVEVIVVDNGSTDGTAEWLEQWWKDCTDGKRQRLTFSVNRGFAAACNHGLKIASGANIILLNNDVILCTGWLERLLDCLHCAPEVGLAGPVSNNVSGEQQVPVPYNTLAEVEGFGWDWGMAHQGERVRLDRLVGFCLAIKREVVEKVGALDEQFGLGTFEDDDYCLRVRQAGYVNMVARDCFIHHFGSRTFIGEGLDMMAMQAVNQKLFEAKHQTGGQ